MGQLSLLSSARRHLRLVTAGVLSGLAAVVFVLTYFQPQDLFINHTVDEPLPAAGAGIIAQGRFNSGEHHTTGSALLVQIPRRGALLRLSSFRTSNGPAVHVWLSAAAAGAGDGTVASAPHVDLGGLKGNIGNQNYAVPAGIDTARYSTVVVWCQRFSVTFGYARLR